jgi:hypothetical protein
MYILLVMLHVTSKLMKVVISMEHAVRDTLFILSTLLDTMKAYAFNLNNFAISISSPCGAICDVKVNSDNLIRIEHELSCFPRNIVILLLLRDDVQLGFLCQVSYDRFL